MRFFLGPSFKCVAILKLAAEDPIKSSSKGREKCPNDTTRATTHASTARASLSTVLRLQSASFHGAGGQSDGWE